MKKLLIIALVLLPVPALACAPAPTCWIKTGPDYLRGVCHNLSKQSLSQIAENLDEPEKIQEFAKACKKFGVTFVQGLAPTVVEAAPKQVTCTGTLIEVDMVAGADFPMSVIYDNGGGETHTCVIDVGRAGHWPLRGSCETGEACTISGPYFKKLGNTYYIRSWDKVGRP